MSPRALLRAAGLGLCFGGLAGTLVAGLVTVLVRTRPLAHLQLLGHRLHAGLADGIPGVVRALDDPFLPNLVIVCSLAVFSAPVLPELLGTVQEVVFPDLERVEMPPRLVGLALAVGAGVVVAAGALARTGQLAAVCIAALVTVVGACCARWVPSDEVVAAARTTRR